MTSEEINFSKIGVLGAGSMGAGLCLLLAEKNHCVFFHDPNDDNVRKLTGDACNIGLQDRVISCASTADVFRNINDGVRAALYLMSVPHGAVADTVLEALRPHLRPADVIIDCGNEHYADTERRQKALAVDGVLYVGCGVSGGYQSARRGPSMSAGGDEADAVAARLLPFLQELAARDDRGRPCTAVVGPGGSGHYVKMIHNGIEQGMMGILAEVWLIMSSPRGSLRMSNVDIADTLALWNRAGELRGCFLVGIGAEVLRARRREGSGGGQHVLSAIRDKVVQDADGSEGTGAWTCAEAVAAHIPAATILAAHLYRCASASATLREAVSAATADNNDDDDDASDRVQEIPSADRQDFLAALHAATYFGFLSCFAEGLDVLRAKDRQAGWHLDYAEIVQLWRAGCIIRADGILDTLASIFAGGGDGARLDQDVFARPEVTAAMHRRLPAVKRVVLAATAADLLLPALSQSFEHFKYMQATPHGPAQFIEAQLDYFGKHMFDTWDEPPGGAETGKHHFEWKPARGTSDDPA
ncbi:6-phosphogluconate dehydrogenase, protein [Cordyceps fumosorosea ARSEF 2679]|uniref:phosphogluconate dehydrogenase (NADP(+)-dependent, decarboxylating) n=1 Tax=Cordyceps fumosorosea (strain ARSEF 2679) TaxID=1081104 RepID=A0A167BI44_CORFA|nr:6-phosphogluconate dehydrogenase, protein [Cordyceps fumosorosea ARSEF 2679]OAA40071.1 6-phosphogluconate dehydrogenase, protein [Cordyceps fumosorosea ARSEF 2679]